MFNFVDLIESLEYSFFFGCLQLLEEGTIGRLGAIVSYEIALQICNLISSGSFFFFFLYIDVHYLFLFYSSTRIMNIKESKKVRRTWVVGSRAGGFD